MSRSERGKPVWIAHAQAPAHKALWINALQQSGVAKRCAEILMSVALSAAYQSMAQRDAAEQLEKAAVRMAILLNRAL